MKNPNQIPQNFDETVNRENGLDSPLLDSLAQWITSLRNPSFTIHGNCTALDTSDSLPRIYFEKDYCYSSFEERQKYLERLLKEDISLNNF